METTGIDSIVVYEDHLPLACKRVDSLPNHWEQEHLSERNLALLNVVLSLGESPVVDGSEESAPWTQEVARVESKLDLVLGLLGDMLARKESLPAPVLTRLSGTGITWDNDTPLKVADLVEIALYLLPGMPRPITVYGVVRSVESMDDIYRVQAAFTEMHPLLQGNLDKLVFRWHRRHIAEVRRSHPSRS